MTTKEGREIPPGLGGIPRENTATRLRQLLKSPQSILLPGVVNALTARLVEQAGFSACYVSGAGIANFKYGLPDVGIVSMAEIVAELRCITDAVNLPIIADADNGYGGPISVMRTVHLFEDAGAAGIQLEDQPIPKRCGHFSGKQVIPSEEMLAKIEAATQARQDSDFVIIARTDARAVLGFDAAIERAQAFVEAGADVLFVEAPASVEELRQIPQLLPEIPLLVNVVEGGVTPHLSADELSSMGYRIILHANLVQRAMLKAAQQTLQHLHDRRESNSIVDKIISWEERQAMVNLEVVDRLENDLQARWQY